MVLWLKQQVNHYCPERGRAKNDRVKWFKIESGFSFKEPEKIIKANAIFSAHMVKVEGETPR